MVVTELGITIEVRDVQLPKAYSPIDVAVLDMVIEVNAVQS